MNRRGFFHRTLGAMTAAICAPLLANGIVSPDYFDDSGFSGLTFCGYPISVSLYCPLNTLYFFNHDGVYRVVCPPNVLAKLSGIVG